ncbi:hypothetical protein AWB67_02280 [Caballeronia terrestris]|uniref:Uncharacterized protein n=1 Tax=Caballeronia terrestris TaxID=1226301 RepID=A0A158I158_9BURK|nr:hypothetical protein AWB67_02280 [Caballeronia terrestris]
MNSFHGPIHVCQGASSSPTSSDCRSANEMRSIKFAWDVQPYSKAGFALNNLDSDRKIFLNFLSLSATTQCDGTRFNFESGYAGGRESMRTPVASKAHSFVCCDGAGRQIDAATARINGGGPVSPGLARFRSGFARSSYRKRAKAGQPVVFYSSTCLFRSGPHSPSRTSRVGHSGSRPEQIAGLVSVV